MEERILPAREQIASPDHEPLRGRQNCGCFAPRDRGIIQGRVHRNRSGGPVGRDLPVSSEVTRE